MALPPPKRVESGALYPVWGQNNYPQWSGTRRRGGESCVGCGGQRAQGPGSHATQTAQGTAADAGSAGGGPHEKAAGSARRRFVLLAVFVRPTSPEQNRTQDPVARQPWGAPVTCAACDYRTGVRV